MTMACFMGVVGSGNTTPSPTYTITPATTSTNEGSSLTFTVTGTNIVNGTYYWTIETNAGDFDTTSGSFSITSNSGSFSVTPSADTTTEGSESFTVALRSVSTSGTILSTSTSVTINDTSLSLVAPFSLDFPAGNPYLLVSNTQSDWNLGTTYTIEFWSKETNASTSTIRTVASQGPADGIDLGFMNGGTLFRNTQNPGIPEPTTGVWTHVAFVGNGGNTYVYHNGVLTGTYTSPGALANGSSDLNIGRRAGVNGQGFLGKLAMIRISTTAKYMSAFNPSISYGVEADTKLFLGSNDPLVDLSRYELNGITTSGNNGGTIYFSKATYPDLNNQIRTGDTVVKVSDSTTSTVTGAVFTSDPSNWGVPVSPGWGGVSTVNFSGPGRHPISVQGAVTVSDDFPSFQSLEFNQPQGDFLSTPASNAWNLGNNWTMEFWIKSNNNSANNINIPGGQWGLINQGGWYGGMPDDNCILIGMAGGYLTINQSANGDISFAEPTAQVWTHVAIVNNGGGSAQKVYYNGVEQTPTGANYTSNGKTNTTADLYIGRLSNQYAGYASHFDGKMAMVRISNTAKYLTAFTATTDYGVEADTKLFLNKYNPFADSSTGTHVITNHGVTLSTNFPGI